MPELLEQHDWIMIGPHRSIQNVSDCCQDGAGQSSKQKEDYRSFGRRRENIRHRCALCRLVNRYRTEWSWRTHPRSCFSLDRCISARACQILFDQQN